MRDTRKNEKYFEEYLKYQYSRVEQKMSKLIGCKDDTAKAQRILTSLSAFEVDLLKAEFSFGADKEKLTLLLKNAISIITQYEKPTAEELLVPTSMAVFLGCKNVAKNLIDKHAEFFVKDRLLNCLKTFIELDNCEWNTAIPLGEEYRVLNEEISEQTLLKYLDTWYNSHSDYAWYNAHLRDTDTYCGYWSFECAALAIVFDVRNTERFSQSEFFPQL